MTAAAAAAAATEYLKRKCYPPLKCSQGRSASPCFIWGISLLNPVTPLLDCFITLMDPNPSTNHSALCFMAGSSEITSPWPTRDSSYCRTNVTDR